MAASRFRKRSYTILFSDPFFLLCRLLEAFVHPVVVLGLIFWGASNRLAGNDCGGLAIG